MNETESFSVKQRYILQQSGKRKASLLKTKKNKSNINHTLYQAFSEEAILNYLPLILKYNHISICVAAL